MGRARSSTRRGLVHASTAADYYATFLWRSDCLESRPRRRSTRPALSRSSRRHRRAKGGLACSSTTGCRSTGSRERHARTVEASPDAGVRRRSSRCRSAATRSCGALSPASRDSSGGARDARAGQSSPRSPPFRRGSAARTGRELVFGSGLPGRARRADPLPALPGRRVAARWGFGRHSRSSGSSSTRRASITSRSRSRRGRTSTPRTPRRPRRAPRSCTRRGSSRCTTRTSTPLLPRSAGRFRLEVAARDGAIRAGG